MERKISILFAAGTVGTALCIGAAMQYWPSEKIPTATAKVPIDFTDVQEVSSSPRSLLPKDAMVSAVLPNSLISNPFSAKDTPQIELPQSPDDTGFDCDVDVSATTAAGAMISVTVTAPCHGSERVTVHHSGLMFTDLMQPDGSLTVEIPALAENALVIASFLDGSGAVAQTQVSSVPFYERVVLQWRGDAGLQLHAREFDAEYFSDGHIWRGANSDSGRAATGDGGFLTKLGSSNAPDALLAEVYTFPSGMTEAFGTIALTVEAEILASNCDTSVEAQTLEIREGKDLLSKELTIDVPGCDTVGDFLMLKNIVEDLTIAAK